MHYWHRPSSAREPSIAEAEANFNVVNAAMLRNTTYINLVDGCAMTIPVPRDDMPPSALMICGAKGEDATVLAVSQVVDQQLNGGNP